MNIKAVQKLCYGVYIICSKKDDTINGQIANTAFQITSEPPTIAISINKQNLTHEYIRASKVFTISVLSVDAPMTQIGTFGFKSGRDIAKFKEVAYRTGTTGAPIVLDNAVGYMECEVLNSVDVGTHTIFIGKMVEADILSDAEPMTYSYYHQIKGGKSPKTAPTYIKEETMQESGTQASSTGASSKYACNVCGYIYDPANGDPDAGIKPGTPFEELPDDWACPVCGAPKSEFTKQE